MEHQEIAVKTADGTCKAGLFRAKGPAHGAVILYMDAFGPRPALYQMAQRMASWGYDVLVPDLFYRFGAYGPFDAKTAFAGEETRAALMAMLGGTSQDQTVQDSAAFLQVFADLGIAGPVGTVGYCMGGARALNAAAAYPERIKAAASFHGGNLASDQPDSPHRRAASIKARVYVGGAGVDRSFPPEQSARLSQALREAEIDHQMENYVGMDHGWCVPDSAAHNPAGAERHWRRLEVFLAEALTP